MSYRRFNLPALDPPLATVATVTTFPVPQAQSVATVADVVAVPEAAVVDAEDWQAHFEERAAIRQFDGGFTRAQAQSLALEDTLARLGPRPPLSKRSLH
jgi:hypothetical protein